MYVHDHVRMFAYMSAHEYVTSPLKRVKVEDYTLSNERDYQRGIARGPLLMGVRTYV